jgi:integrase
MGVKVREKVPGSGEWWVYIYHQGKRTAKKIGAKASANKFKKAIEEQIHLGQFAPQQEIPTLEQYYRKFEKGYLRTAVKESTRASYEMSFRVHILPELGRYRLDEIDRDRMIEFVAHLSEKEANQPKKRIRKGAKGTPSTSADKEPRKLSKHSIRLVLAALGILYSQAIESQLANTNPTRNLGKFYRKAPTRNKEIQPLTSEEVPKFLNAIKQRSPQHYPLFLMAVHTGMRSGELVGLQWNDIDFNTRTALVRRNFVRGKVTSTKTGKTRRVDLSDAVIHELRTLERRRRETYLKEGKNQIPNWVFCNDVGNPQDMYNLKRRHFKRSLRESGLREIRFHDLRHTYATLLIQQGESLAYVKDQLGHSSIKMTVDTYTHWIPGSNRKAVNQLPTLEPNQLKLSTIG